MTDTTRPVAAAAHVHVLHEGYVRETADGDRVGSTVTLMASSANTLGKQDALAVILDPVGSTNTSMTPVTVVATSGAGSTFRGVAIPPHL